MYFQTFKIDINYRLNVSLTCIVYLVVAFKNPGYVTSYVLKGDDIEEEIERMRIYENKKNINSMNSSFD